MGCGSSKLTQSTIVKPLYEWSAKEVEQWLSQQPSLCSYATRELKGTPGAVIAKLTDEVLRDAGVSNALHRMQLLHLRDNLLKSVSDVPELCSITHTSPVFPLQNATQVCSETTDLGSGLLERRLNNSKSVDVEDGKYMAMLKILPSGNLIRVIGETLPLEANKLASTIVELHKLHCVAHCNNDNCRRFVKRCCQVQGLFTAKTMQYLVLNSAVIHLVEEVLEDAIDLFSLFSRKGWLERLRAKSHDKYSFNVLDNALIDACLVGHLKLSEDSILNLQQCPIYQNSTKPLKKSLLEIGGMEGIRRDISEAETQLSQYFPDLLQSKMGDILKEEVEHYELTVDAYGPHSVIRHPSLQIFWKKHFGHKERISYNEFWQCFPNMMKEEEVLTLSKLLMSSENKEIFQYNLTRSLPKVLSITEMDFFFEPRVPLEANVEKLLDSTSQLMALGLSKASSSISLSEGPITHGLFYNFPSMMQKPLERRELLMQIVFGAQDKGTNFIVLSGASGLGKRMLANQVARFLLSTGYWTEAYWIDLSGITSHTAASFQIMHQMGVLFEISDKHFLLGFLQRRQGSLGLVISGISSLCNTRDDECRLLDYLESLTESTCDVQILLVSDKKMKETRARMVTHNVVPFSLKESGEWMKQSLGKQIKGSRSIDKIVTAINGHPLCLDLVSSLVKYGELTIDQLVKHLEENSVSSKALQEVENDHHGIEISITRCVSLCILSLKTELMSFICALSTIQGSFDTPFACNMMESAGHRDLEIMSILRRLSNRKFLQYNDMKGSYLCHPIIRSVCSRIMSTLKINCKELSKCFMDTVFRCSIWKAYKMTQSGSCILAALHVFHTHESHIYQFLNTASEEGQECSDCRVVVQKALWEALPCFVSRIDSNALDRFYSSCLETSEKVRDFAFKAQCLIRQGELLKEVGRLKDSEDAIRDGLTVCLSDVGEHTLEAAKAYHSLGGTLVQLKRFDEAVTQYEKALEAYKVASGEKSLDYSNCCLASCTAYHLAKKDTKAHEMCLHAVEIRKQWFGTVHIQVGKALTAVGAQLKFMKKDKEAEQFYRDALQVLEKSLGIEHPEVASLLVEFSMVLRAIRKFTLAEPMLQRALQIRESVFGPLHHHTAFCVQNLSILYKSMYRFEEAAAFAQRELELQKQILGPADLQIPTSLMNLATILCEAGDYSNAYRHCKRALGIREKQLGNSDPTVAQSCNLLGILLRHSGKYEEAKEVAQRSFDIRYAKNGDKPHPDTAASLNGLAESERGLQQLDAAEKHCREGLTMRTRIFPAHHLTIGLSLTTLASILTEKGSLEEAEESIRTAVSIRERHFGKENFQVMQGYDQLAEILSLKGQLEEAEETIHISVDVKIKTLGQKHPDVAKSLIVLGSVLMANSNSAAAKQKLIRAINILGNIFGENHYLIEKAKHLLQSH